MQTKERQVSLMEYKYAVALMRGDDEKIMGLFDTKEEADEFGKKVRRPHKEGLQYCFFTAFRGGKPCGEDIRICDYYNCAI